MQLGCGGAEAGWELHEEDDDLLGEETPEGCNAHACFCGQGNECGWFERLSANRGGAS